MKNFKQWLWILMATFMFVGIAAGCTNEEPQEETETEENQTEEGTETEDNNEEGAEEEAE
ncbi:hypothetical protein F4V44_16780 [Niallia endozanthoxylica]|uniref:Uncharacterized protein n=2 Tax=Niallia endozanthoxylica TaxID=2036016 RepID=A0A5J5HNA1_9BACI|nr:hypothetical protein F4V44_16780 [Niallia endozanthoxylica]